MNAEISETMRVTILGLDIQIPSETMRARLLRFGVKIPEPNYESYNTGIRHADS